VNSWQTLLMIQMSQGRYLSSKPPTERDWLLLWALARGYPMPGEDWLCLEKG